MAQKLYSGDISASPLNYDKKKTVCSYCDYRDICGNHPLRRERLIPDNTEEIKTRILGEEEN
jgi:ATP-dependent helicase/DNAse subunit B